MSAKDAWAWIYTEQKRKNELHERSKLPEICFSGFSASDRARLSSIASDAGFLPKETVTKSLRILVTGANAGESKIKKALSQGTMVTDEKGFLDYIESSNN